MKGPGKPEGRLHPRADGAKRSADPGVQDELRAPLVTQPHLEVRFIGFSVGFPGQAEDLPHDSPFRSQCPAERRAATLSILPFRREPKEYS
jgi:hypothetical protein